MTTSELHVLPNSAADDDVPDTPATEEEADRRVMLHMPVDVRSASSAFLAVAVGIALFRWMDEFIVPVLLGAMVSYALTPIVDRLESIKLPRMIGAALVIAVMLGAAGGAAYGLRGQADAFLTALPRLTAKVRQSVVGSGANRHGALARVEAAATAIEAAATGRGVPPAAASPRGRSDADKTQGDRGRGDARGDGQVGGGSSDSRRGRRRDSETSRSDSPHDDGQSGTKVASTRGDANDGSTDSGDSTNGDAGDNGGTRSTGGTGGTGSSGSTVSTSSTSNVDETSTGLDSASGSADPKRDAVLPERPAPLATAARAPAMSPLSLRGFLLTGTLGVAAFAGQALVVVFVALFLLAAGNGFRRKIIGLAGTRLSQRRVTLQALDEMHDQIQRYLMVQLATSVVVGVATAIVFFAFGLDNAMVWGVVAAAANLVPYLGSVATSGLAAVAGLVQFGRMDMGLWLAASSFTIHLLVGNLLTPWLTGRASRMSPFVVFVGVLFFGWLWGVAGLVLAFPILVAVKITCDRVDDLKPLGELMSA